LILKAAEEGKMRLPLRYPLNYMHGNPVQRGMVASPDQWPWSSFRFYFLGEESILPIDRLP